MPSTYSCPRDNVAPFLRGQYKHNAHPAGIVILLSVTLSKLMSTAIYIQAIQLHIYTHTANSTNIRHTARTHSEMPYIISVGCQCLQSLRGFSCIEKERSKVHEKRLFLGNPVQFNHLFAKKCSLWIHCLHNT